VYRTLNMAEKYFEGKVSPVSVQAPGEFKECVMNLQKEYVPLMEDASFNIALEKVFKFVSVMNKYIEDTKPWVLWKEKREGDIKNFLYSLLEGIRIISLYIYPFMPGAAISISRQLGIKDSSFSLMGAEWAKQKSFNVKKEQPLFPRIDETRIITDKNTNGR